MSKKKTAPSSNPVSDDPFGGQSHPVAVEGERAFQVVDAQRDDVEPWLHGGIPPQL